MIVRPVPSLTIAVAAAALAACHPMFHHHHGESYKVVTTLDCPTSEGALTRKSISADGKSCAYVGGDGESVTLQLIPVSDGVDAALNPLENSLRAEVPASESAASGPSQGRVDIDLPGIHIHAAGRDTEGGQVRIGQGVSINDGNTVVAGKSGGIDIEARKQGAEIRVNEGHGNIRRDFVLASDTPGPHGYRVAGYEARGPEGGPVVVGSMLVKSDDHERLDHDVRELIRMNVSG